MIKSGAMQQKGRVRDDLLGAWKDATSTLASVDK
jgi:hypothetical protein